MKTNAYYPPSKRKHLNKILKTHRECGKILKTRLFTQNTSRKMHNQNAIYVTYPRCIV